MAGSFFPACVLGMMAARGTKGIEDGDKGVDALDCAFELAGHGGDIVSAMAGAPMAGQGTDGRTSVSTPTGSLNLGQADIAPTTSTTAFEGEVGAEAEGGGSGGGIGADGAPSRTGSVVMSSVSRPGCSTGVESWVNSASSSTGGSLSPKRRSPGSWVNSVVGEPNGDQLVIVS